MRPGLLWTFIVVGLCVSPLAGTQPLHADDVQPLIWIIGNYSSVLPVGWSAADVLNACDWPRVTCGFDRRIEQIITFDQQNESYVYNTTIPAAYGLLSNLKALFINGGEYYGTIPPQLFTPNLRLFTAHENKLWGAVPPEIANSPLQDLYLKDNLLTSMPKLEIEHLIRNTLTILNLAKNSFNCSSFTPNYFNISKSAALDPTTYYELGLENNVWGGDQEGYFCGYKSTPFNAPYAPAQIRPIVSNNFNYSTPSNFVVESATTRLEVVGSQLRFFGKFRNGTVFKEEFVSIDFSAINQYYWSNRSLIEDVPIRGYDRHVVATPTTHRFETTLTQRNGHTFSWTLIVELDTATLKGVKFSFEVNGLHVYYSDGSPAKFGLPVQVSLRAPVSASAQDLTCTDSSISTINSALGAYCNSSISLINWKFSTALTFAFKSKKTSMTFDTPFDYREPGNPQIFIMDAQKPIVFFYPHADTKLFTNDRAPKPIVTSDLNEQAGVLLSEMSGIAMTNFLYDPTVSITLLIDDSSADSPDQTAVKESVNVAVIVSVIVVVVVVGAIILTILIVPSIRMKLFPWLGAEAEAKRRVQEAAKKAGSPERSPSSSPPSVQPDLSRNRTESLSWTRATSKSVSLRNTIEESS